MHDFEPTPEDIINIKNADLFIYVGGESDEWVEDLLEDNEIPEEKNLAPHGFSRGKRGRIVRGYGRT